MAYNPWNKRPPVLPQLTRAFTLASGDVLALTLRKLGTIQQTEVYELTKKLTERYVTGDDEFVESKMKSGEGPIVFPPVGSETIQPTETMIQGAAFIFAMQQAAPEDTLDPEAWIAFQAVEDPADWIAIQKFAREVNAIGKPASTKAADVPNGSGADTGQSSGRSLGGTSNTRKSAHALTLSSGVSTNDSQENRA